MDFLIKKMEGTQLNNQEYEIFYRNYRALELCVHGGEEFDEILANKITESFVEYIAKINFSKGPVEAVTAKGYITLFLEDNDINKKLWHAFNAHQYIDKVIQTN